MFCEVTLMFKKSATWQNILVDGFVLYAKDLIRITRRDLKDKSHIGQYI